MIQCQNCGQINSQASNFCRFCGSKFLQSQFPNGENFENSPPRPYSWKTDEFQVTETKARKPKIIERVQPLPRHITHSNPQPLVYQQPQSINYGFNCPRCSSHVFPRMERKISNAGWIVFAVLLVTFFPLFWIGLLIKEDVRVCPICNLKID